VTSRQRQKGSRGELDAVAMFARYFPWWPVRRRLQEGRRDDIGDLEGIPHTTVQVANVDNLLDAIGHKLPELVVQQGRAGTTFGVLLIRRRGGRFIAVQTEEQFTTMLRLAIEAKSIVWAKDHLPKVDL